MFLIKLASGVVQNVVRAGTEHTFIIIILRFLIFQAAGITDNLLMEGLSVRKQLY